MELLIIKASQQYIRIKDNTHLLVSLDKASVYPLDKIDVVQQQVSLLKEKGVHNVCIKKLILTEKNLRK